MANWQAWTAAFGGLVALGELWPGTVGATPWYALVGGLAALIFGVWAAYSE